MLGGTLHHGTMQYTRGKPASPVADKPPAGLMLCPGNQVDPGLARYTTCSGAGVQVCLQAGELSGKQKHQIAQ